MGDSGVPTSLLLLGLALLLLWMAVTDRLSRVLDAYDVIIGKSTTSATSGVSKVASAVNAIDPAIVTSIHLPSLPDVGHVDAVGLS